jgi:hypothetical protein
MQAVMFQGERTYNGMISWMRKLLKEVKKINEEADSNSAGVVSQVDTNFGVPSHQPPPMVQPSYGPDVTLLTKIQSTLDNYGNGID